MYKNLVLSYISGDNTSDLYTHALLIVSYHIKVILESWPFYYK